MDLRYWKLGGACQHYTTYYYLLFQLGEMIIFDK